MRRLSGAAVLLWAVVSVGGCAAISGLDQITEQECAPNCEGGADVGVDSAADHGGDQTALPDTGGEGGDDATVDGSDDGPAETAPPGDAKGDSKTDGGGNDGPVDSPVTSDAPFDSGCGPLDVPAHCGACPNACQSVAQQETSSSCSGQPNGQGATCSYTCALGWLDCNGATNPPNLDGCECHAPTATQGQCCGAGCPVQHTDGLLGAGYPPVPTFYDCVPVGTMNSQLAQDACNHYMVGAGFPASCGNYSEADASVPDSWCSGATTGDCICWTYSGTYVGTIFDSKGQGTGDPTGCYYGASSQTFN